MLLRIIVSFGFALALVGTLAIESTAQTSYSGWYATCRQRCVGMKIGCGHCDGLMETCRQTACWTEGKQYGSKRHCNLKKS
jgi:hypothetical protein